MRLLPIVRGCLRCSRGLSQQQILLQRISSSSSRSNSSQAAARRGLATRAQRAGAGAEEDEQDVAAAGAAGEMLKRVVASRHSAKAFDTARCEVPEAVLAEVLAMTLVRVGWMGGGAF